jgi:hypothetical protein
MTPRRFSLDLSIYSWARSIFQESPCKDSTFTREHLNVRYGMYPLVPAWSTSLKLETSNSARVTGNGNEWSVRADRQIVAAIVTKDGRLSGGDTRDCAADAVGRRRAAAIGAER